MDPNEALRLVRESVGELVQADDDDTLPGSQTGQIVDAFAALDEWLQRGGFLPADWRGESDYWCAECGTKDATTFVVTFTDGSRTEVCRACDIVLHAPEEQHFVEIVYNTDPEGAWVEDGDYSNRTLHGPFASEDDAHTWLDTRTDGDRDVKDVTIGLLNKADPARPFVNALPGEPDPRVESTCRLCGRSIVLDQGMWIDLSATGDDRIWRETCGESETFPAHHKPGEIK